MDIILAIQNLVDQFPILSTIFVVIGALRVVFKPIVSLLESIVAVTPSPKDNAMLDGAKSSMIWKGLVWLLDFTASIKLPKKK